MVLDAVQDMTFMPRGFPVDAETTEAVAIAPDGKAVVALSGANDPYFLISRLNPDGTLDDTFGNYGLARLDVLGRSGRSLAVAVLPNGKILAAGQAFNPQEGDSDFALVRVTSSGANDVTFGNNGAVLLGLDDTPTRTPANQDSWAAVAVLPDGKILVAGSTYYAPDGAFSDYIVARYTPDGTLDPTFGVGGIARASFCPTPCNRTTLATATSLVVQLDGRIVVGGYVTGSFRGEADFALARFTAAGMLDPTFGTGGTSVVALGGHDLLYGLAVQADGRFFAAGESTPAGAASSAFVALRLTAAGQPDPTFPFGAFPSQFSTAQPAREAAHEVLVQPDGKVVFVGTTSGSPSGAPGYPGVRVAMLRIHPDGTPDRTFGTQGKFVYAWWEGRAAALQPDGQIVVGGLQPFPESGRSVPTVSRVTFGPRQPQVVVAPDAGGLPRVKVFSPSGTLLGQFDAYGPSFTGGVRVALADIDFDGAPEIFAAPGPGGAPFVNVFDGRTFRLLHQWQVYGDTFTLGVNLAVGNVLGEHLSLPEVIVAPEAGGLPAINVFDLRTRQRTRTFNAYEVNFTGGVRVATGDVDGNGQEDVLTAPGPGGLPIVNVFNVQSSERLLLAQIQVYGDGYTGGIFLATGDVAGDGRKELLVGPQAGVPLVNAFDVVSRALLRQYQAYGPEFLGGIRVAAEDADGDGKDDVAVGPGSGGQPYVRVLDGLTGRQRGLFLAYSDSFTGGLFLAGPWR